MNPGFFFPVQVQLFFQNFVQDYFSLCVVEVCPSLAGVVFPLVLEQFKLY